MVPASLLSLRSARHRWSMTVAFLAAASVVMAACSGPVVIDPAAAPGSPPPTSAAETETSQPPAPGGDPEPAAPGPSTEPTATPTEPAEPEPVVQDDVGITPTGIPVAVLDRTEDAVIVRSPCGNEVAIPSVEPLGEVQVVVDPGHGGPVDTGAVGANGLVEAHINLAVANAFVAELGRRGITAVSTRTGDYAVPIRVRTDFTDATDAAIFVSIHHNAPNMPRSAGPGTEVFVQGSAESIRLGALMQDAIVTALAQHDVNWVSAPDAGVLRVQEPDGSEAYGLVRLAATPMALVELGYLANPHEAAFFATDVYPVIAGQALADAAEAYLTTDEFADAAPAHRTFTAGRSHAAVRCTDPPLTP
jgi:N-acetylmuramoyl-L-alanine amidase